MKRVFRGSDLAAALSNRPPPLHLPYCLVWYKTADDSEHERVWNSRDGVVSAAIRSATTGEEMRWYTSEYAPDHVPEVGDRIFVALTPQRARIVAASTVEEHVAAGYGAELEALFESREDAIETLASAMLEVEGGCSDLITVTSGYIEELLEVRKRGADPEITIGVQREPAPRTYDIASIEVRVGGVPIDLSGAEPEEDWSPLGEALGAERGLYFDRQLRPIDMMTMVRLSADMRYKVVARTDISDRAYVSTVWLGINHSHDPRRPIVFETLVFRKPDKPPPRLGGGVHEWVGDSETMRRYYTEAEALAGHEEVVRQERAKLG